MLVKLLKLMKVEEYSPYTPSSTTFQKYVGTLAFGGLEREAQHLALSTHSPSFSPPPSLLPPHSSSSMLVKPLKLVKVEEYNPYTPSSANFQKYVGPLALGLEREA